MSPVAVNKRLILDKRVIISVIFRTHCRDSVEFILFMVAFGEKKQAASRDW